MTCSIFNIQEIPTILRFLTLKEIFLFIWTNIKHMLFLFEELSELFEIVQSHPVIPSVMSGL